MRATTPWGKASIVEEAIVEQEIGGRDYHALVQLLELRDGAQLVRFGARGAAAKRLGCLSLRADDLERLTEALLDTPRLATVLRLGVG